MLLVDLMRKAKNLKQAQAQINEERDTKERKRTDARDTLVMKMGHVEAMFAVDRKQQQKREKE